MPALERMLIPGTVMRPLASAAMAAGAASPMRTLSFSPGFVPNCCTRRRVMSALPESATEPLPGPVIETVRIKFLSPVPKFVGPKRQVFGPYGKEEEANLPGEIAKLLIRKGRALPVET